MGDFQDFIDEQYGELEKKTITCPVSREKVEISFKSFHPHGVEDDTAYYLIVSSKCPYKKKHNVGDECKKKEYKCPDGSKRNELCQYCDGEIKAY
jgi:hypothetical protein